MNTAKNALPALVLSLLFAGHAQALTTHKGVGIVRPYGDPPSASVRILEASVDTFGSKSLGSIRAELGVAESRFEKSANGSWTQIPYVPSAQLFIYLLDGQKESLVFSGYMEPEKPPMTLVAPPSNEPPRKNPYVFTKGISQSGDNKPLSLKAGRYRAEVVFYLQEIRSGVGSGVGVPAPREVAGAADEFTVNQLYVAPVSVARGEISVASTFSPRSGATSAQIAELKAAARREYERVTSEARAFLNAQGPTVSISPVPDRKPWIYNISVAVGGSRCGFLVVDGETYSENSASVLGSLQKIVNGGDFSRALSGGTFRISTTTNITLYPK